MALEGNSFIPKTSFEEAPRMEEGKNILTILAFLGLLLSAGAVAGLFFYKETLVAQNIAKDKELAGIKNTFEPATIESLVDLSGRIETAKELLSKHVVFSKLLAVLEEKTLQSVRFSKFAYRVSPEGAIEITLFGEGKSYASVALQSDLLGTVPQFKDMLFSNLSLGATGTVTFDVTFKVDPALVTYEAKI